MSEADTAQAARAMSHQRWGNQVAVRAAATVIERAAELPESLRAEVVGALTTDRTDTEAGK